VNDFGLDFIVLVLGCEWTLEKPRFSRFFNFLILSFSFLFILILFLSFFDIFGQPPWSNTAFLFSTKESRASEK